jgi:hypothetical protein
MPSPNPQETTVNETDLSTLLHRETTDLDPDVHALVREGRARGVRRRHRRQAGVALASAAVVAAAGVALSLGTGGSPESPTVATDPTTTTTPAPATTEATETTEAPVERRAIAVPPGEIPATFASLEPGELTIWGQKEPDEPGADFRWNGFAVRVMFQKSEYLVGTPIGQQVGRWQDAGTPMQRCRRADHGIGSGCREAPDGSAYQLASTGPATHDGPDLISWAQLYTTDGWDVLLTAANVADTKTGGPALAPEPPFTPEQLLAVAQDPVWFTSSPRR